MIYYFSGTGNSLVVAQRLATSLHDTLASMVLPTKHEDTTDEAPATIGLVFPVYAWGLPTVVKEFVRVHLPHIARIPNAYIYAVMTCGDDMGLADQQLSSLLEQYAHRGLDAAFSVQMPNTYVCLPGFDVDSESLTEQKLSAMPARIEHIADEVKAQKQTTDVVRGAMPWVKSRIIRPLFERFLITEKYFHTNTACIQCGACSRVCPVSNITHNDQGYPVWHANCTGCLACYHCCPRHAIHFGRFTKHKGQKDVATPMNVVKSTPKQ